MIHRLLSLFTRRSRPDETARNPYYRCGMDERRNVDEGCGFDPKEREKTARLVGVKLT